MIFLDTSYINGLILKNDSYSVNSGNIEPYLENESKATNVTVLIEVLNSLTNYNFFGSVDDLLSDLLNFEILDCLTPEDYNSAMNLFKFYNGSINFSDCTILQSMQKYGITRIASFDSDFDKIKGIQRIDGFN